MVLQVMLHFKMPGADGPLVNEYKIDFIKKRLLETLFGGPRCLCGQKIPVCVHFGQLALHIFPFFIGGTFLAFTETNTISVFHGMCCVGSVMFIYTLLVQCCSWRIQKKATTVAPVKPKSVDHITNDDVNLHDSSCCSAKVTEFIIPLKRYKLNLIFHAFISGSMCAGIFHYLAPSSLHILFENKTIIYLLLIFGWFVTCVAQYSLSTTSPPEPVVYHTLDTFEIASIMRPFYVLLFVLLHMIAWHYSWLLYVDQYLHVTFIFLPLLWFMGILPPLDALFPWFGEQFLICFLGGSAMATDCRLIVMLTFSVINIIILYFIPSSSICIIIAAFSGYIFSLDFNRFWNFLLKIFCKKQRRLKYTSGMENLSFKSEKMENEQLIITVFYITMFILLGIIVILCHFRTKFEKEDEAHLLDIFGYILLFLLVLNKIFCSLQQVFMLKNIFTNPFHPSDTSQRTIFVHKKKHLELLGYIRLIFINIGAPLIMASYLCIISKSKYTGDEAKIQENSKLIWIITIVRAFRWIWQQTENALLEISVIHFMNHFVPFVFSLDFFEQFLLIAIIHNRILQFFQKLHFALILIISSVTLKKQRIRCSFAIAAMNILFLPILIAIILLSSVIAAPLLPLFTLPIFIIGFPRPVKIWPSQVKKDIICSGDAVFYKQVTPMLITNFQRCHILGSLGTVNVGDYFLIRFEDRVALLSILEKGFGFSTLSIKGLELQETSCHTVEATYLDSILSNAFERDKGNSSKQCFCLNPYPFHIYHPLTAVFLVTYSDTRNVLTALIDSPDTLKLIALSFLKSLVWVLIHHCARKHFNEAKEKELKKTKSDNHLDEVWPLATHPRTKSAETIRKLPKAKRVEECVADISWFPSKSPVIIGSDALPTVDSPNHLSHTWSDDDDDPLGENPLFTANNKMSSNKSSRPATNIRSMFIPHIPGSIGDTSLQEGDLGFPAVDVNITEKGDIKTNHLTIIQNSVKYSAVSSKLSPPLQWLELPFDDSVLNIFLNDFPVKWYYFVINLVSAKIFHFDENTISEIESDKTLMKVFQKVILACYVIINNLHSKPDNQVHLKPGHVYKTFIGDIPWSSFLEWLINKEDLFHLVLKAYGYATKFALDQVLLGEVTEDQDIADYFTDYDDNWYIGNDANVKWGEHILQNKPNLFSLGYNPIQRTFTSHLLTLQEMPICIGSLNPEAVRGLWSSLVYELLYLTNDDEERYSIQAHPYLFRNLIIQSADSPLGYPLYSSEPLSCGFESIWKYKKRH